MAVSPRSGRSRSVLIFLVFLSITFITLDSRSGGGGVSGEIRGVLKSVFSPIQSVASTIVEPFENAISGITGYGALKEENAVLRDEVADLERRASVGDDVRKELADALALQGLPFIGDIPTVAARVVSLPTSNFEQTIEIDKGSKAGIDTGMPVVTSAGLIGRVIDTTARRSTVQLISDPTSSVGVLLPISNERGVADGEGKFRDLLVDFIEPSVKVAPGEIAVTSGVGGSFPAGIPVGHVDRSKDIPGELQRWVTIEVSADFERLNLVKVLQWKTQL